MVLTVSVFWFTITQTLENYLDQQADVLGNSLATQAAFNATQSILTNDLLSLNVLLNKLVVDDNISSVRVFNKKDELLAETLSGHSKRISNTDFRPSKKHKVYTSSINFRDDAVGYVLITLNKIPEQKTLKHLSNLLIGVSIFICTISLLLVVLMTRWLFSSINDANDTLNACIRGHQDTKLLPSFYKEGKILCDTIRKIQSLEWPKPHLKNVFGIDNNEKPVKTQIEIDFGKILADSKQRSCILYIDILNIKEWHEKMTPLQVVNLLTPIYRAIFQASRQFKGQVHQYRNDSILIFFKAENSSDFLYIEAICTTHVIIGVIDELLKNELYKNAPPLNLYLGLHEDTSHVVGMMKNNTY